MLTRKVAEKNDRAMKSIYTTGLRYLVMLLVPVTIFSFFYAENLIQVIFEYGNFTKVYQYYDADFKDIFLCDVFFSSKYIYN